MDESLEDCTDSGGDTTQQPRYLQRLERTTGGQVVLMEWSPTLDLLAVALADQSVRRAVHLPNLTSPPS